MPGISAVLLAEDMCRGLNDVGPVMHDEPLLADKEGILFHSQIVALVVGESQEACRSAAAKSGRQEYEPTGADFKP